MVVVMGTLMVNPTQTRTHNPNHLLLLPRTNPPPTLLCGLDVCDKRLHTARLCLSSPNSPFSLNSTFTLSIHLRLNSVFLDFLSLPHLYSSLFPPHILHTSSHDMSVPLHPYFLHFRCFCNSMIPCYVHLYNITHPSQHLHFRHV